jgi:EAL domain-containing protein (putative c-di-GMP-specific phosphodiesterase class I)/GGDEF domain-containing protein
MGVCYMCCKCGRKFGLFSSVKYIKEDGYCPICYAKARHEIKKKYNVPAECLNVSYMRDADKMCNLSYDTRVSEDELCFVSSDPKEDKKEQEVNEYPGAGLPNIKNLILDLDELIEKHPLESFTVVGVKCENMDQINRYMGWEIERKSFDYILNNASESFREYSIYYVYLNEFVIVLPNVDVFTAIEKGKTFVEKIEEIKQIEGIPANCDLNFGVVNFPLHGKNSGTILQKLGITFEQDKNSNRNIIMNSFSEALKEDMLTLNYHPRIDLKRNKVIGVEALLRWKDFDEKNIGITELIKMIEDAGFASELTKWVVKSAIEQLKEWHGLGLDISVSVNLCSKDLNDNFLVHYTQKLIKRYEVDPAYLEYELTERILIENDCTAANLLNEFKDIGLKITIDNYGTGYNSLINIIKLPLDYIKIDKYFIDNITDSQNKKMMEDMINLIHNLGKEVCAEGVETKEQLELLREMGCDYVQGYYYSKPLPSEEVEKLVFNINNIERDL